MNTENMDKLISFLERLNPDNFDLSIVTTGPVEGLQKVAENPQIHQCGTAGCVAGYMPAVFPETFEWVAGLPHRKDNGRFVASFGCLSQATGIHEDIARCIVYEGYYAVSDRTEKGTVALETVVTRLKQVRSGEVTLDNYRGIWFDES